MGLLRFLLAISVVVFHANHTIFGAKLMGGMLAVQMFYIISGFYMSLILNEKYVQQNNSYYLFITNRFLRLFPLYYVILLVVIVLNIVLYYNFDMISPTLKNYISYGNKLSFSTILYLILSHILIFGQDIALFLGLNLDSGNLYFISDFHHSAPEVNGFMFLGQAWTISLELMFYLIAPFILRKKPISVALIIAASIAIRFILYFGFDLTNDPWTYRFLPTELIYFLLGYFCYKSYKYFSNKVVSQIYPIVGLVILLFLTLFYGNLFELCHTPFTHKLLHLGYIVTFVFFLPFIFGYTKSMKWDIQIGDLSYPIYLSHGIFLLIGYFFQIENVYFVVGGTIIFSYLLNKLVSDKIEKIRQKRVKK